MEDKETIFLQNLKSKNWKIRNQAYQDLLIEFSQSNNFKQQNYQNLIQLFQHETMIPALESALDTLIVVPNLSPLIIKKIFSHIGNTKNSVKTRMSKLILHLDADEMATVLCEYVKHTSPKISCAAVQYLIQIVQNVKDLNDICNLLNTIFNHPDSSVRQEGYKLTTEIYKIKGNSVKQYLTNLKPIQLKELEDLFSHDEVIEININYENINSEKWNIRLEALKDLYKLVKSNNNYTHDLFIPTIVQRLNDPNNQVFLLTCDIVQQTCLNNPKIINLLIDRLKDKKVQVTDKIKETLTKIKLSNIPSSYWKSKSPEIKYHLIDLCIKLKLKQYENNVRELLKDSSKIVRCIASEACKKFETNFREECNLDTKNEDNEVESVEQNYNTTNVTNGEKNREHFKITNNEITKVNINKFKEVKKSPQIKNSNNSKSPKFNNPNTSKSPKVNNINNYKSHINQNNDNLKEYFINKYPFFNEKIWTIRMEGIKNNKNYLLNENINDLSFFFFELKDPNFLLNIEYSNILLELITPACNRDPYIIKYCLEKCTEIKLKNKILEILKKLDNDFVVQNILDELNKNKQGKKVVELLKIIGNFQLKKEYKEKIKKIQVIGLQEKKAYDSLILSLDKNLEDVGFFEKNEINETEKHNRIDSNDDFDEFKIHETCISKDLSHTSSNYLKSELINSNALCDKKTNDIYFDSNNHKLNNNLESNYKRDYDNKHKVCFNKKDVTVTPIKTNKTFSTPVDMINYYIKNNLQSSYFNSLLLELISTKYILDYNICYSLVQHLIKNSFLEELDMIDRVYPVTKLYLVLKNINDDDSIKVIINLINKYKMVNDKIEFEKIKLAVRECDNFLSLVDRLNNPKKSLKNFDGRAEENIKNEGFFENRFEVSSGCNMVDSSLKMVYKKIVNENREFDRASNDFNKTEINYEKSQKDFDKSQLESSLSNLSITPVQKKYKKEEPENLYKCIIQKNSKSQNIQNNNIIFTDNANIGSNQNENIRKDMFHKNKEINNFLYKETVNNYSNALDEGTAGKNKVNFLYKNNLNTSNLQSYKSHNKIKNLTDSMKSCKKDTNVIQDEKIIGFNEKNKIDFRVDFDKKSKNEICKNISFKSNQEDKKDLSNNFEITNNNFLNPNIKKTSITTLEIILDNIIDTDQNKSEDALKKLLDLDLPSISNYSNSIMSSISIQLLDVLHRPLYCKLILKVLLRFSKSKEFMSQLRKETFESVTIDLINMLKYNEMVSEILINMCINCTCATVLSGYLSILNSDTTIILKLIWKHSKVISYSEENTAEILKILEDWYRKNLYCDLLENQTAFKICIIHLREICNLYESSVYKFKLNGYCKKIVDRIINGEEINLSVLRN